MYRILILEDDEDLRPLLAEVLEEEGFLVDTCGAGDEAIHLAREGEYDLMVADIRMDGLDGLSALSQIQSYRPGVDALVISGYADAEQAERASRLGLGAVLKKPFQIEDFLHKVNELLKSRSQKRSVKEAFEALLSTSCWSQRHLARLLDDHYQKTYNFNQLFDACGLLCSEMGLLGSQLENVRAAAIAAAWMQTTKASSLEPPMDIPEHSRQWLQFLGEWWNGKGPRAIQGPDIPLQSRIIVVALACSLVEAVDDLDTRWPGRFDPMLLTIIERAFRLPESPLGPTHDTREVTTESLLDLAKTLVRRGDLEHASRALQDVINRDAESQKGVEAMLMLARLKQRAGMLEESKQIAFRAPELAQSFGPGLAAHALRESGRLLLDLAEGFQAGRLLHSAHKIYYDLGLEAQAAECGLLWCLVEGKLAQNQQTSERLALLLRPRYRSHLAPSAEALVHGLLSEPQLPEDLQRSLARLMLAHPQAAISATMKGSESVQNRTLMLVNKAGPHRYPELLKKLSESHYREVQKAAAKLTRGQSGEKAVLPLNVFTLGGLVAEVGDQQVPDRSWKTNKVRYLFARLVEAFPNPVHEDVLIEAFWPGDPEKGKRSLYTSKTSIRAALRKAGLESKNYVESALNGVKLADDIDLIYDLDNLRDTLKEAVQKDRDGNVAAAVVGYRRAVLEADKPYLPNSFYDWTLRLRAELESELLSACIRLTEISFGQKRFDEALEFARRALTYDSANETATGLLLSALLEVGRPAEAVKKYNLFCEVLTEELGVSEITTMEQLMRRAVKSAKISRL